MLEAKIEDLKSINVYSACTITSEGKGLILVHGS